MEPGSTNIAQCVEHCRQQLQQSGAWFGHGTDNALDEAAWLVLALLDKPLDGQFDDWNEPVSAGQLEHIDAVLKQRIQGQPLAYLLGEAWFCGLPFKVTPDVLVPRSPMAELIVRQCRPWVDPDQLRSVLDLCTGSGCIAIALARYLPGVNVDAADLSEQALAVAAENVARHGLGDRVELLASDGFDGLAGRRYELIMSNPPYVPAADLEQLPPEYQAEPGMGLVSGADGLDLPLRILAQAADHLSPDGVLICEVGESAQRLQDCLSAVPFTWLEFEQGGEGVFTIDRNELEEARDHIRRVREQRENVI